MVFIRRTREYLLHLRVNKEQFQTARSLRHDMTKAEKVLWNELKNRKMCGLKFRRQYPIHYYIADFYCHEKRLIIEVDGGIHRDKSVREHDENRSAELEGLGIRVIRVTNEQILKSLDEVIDKIKKSLNDESC
ncbi:MAG: endonuclease domain-containing protein [Bacteroidales bacterium]